MNFFDHKDLGNHLLQLCPKVVKHPAYGYQVFDEYAASVFTSLKWCHKIENQIIDPHLH